MHKKLFFVESIYSTNKEEFQVTLSRTEDVETIFKVVDVTIDQMIIKSRRTVIREGWYVYYDHNNHTNPFDYGNLDRYAVKQIQENRRLRKLLLEYQKETSSIEELRKKTMFLNSSKIEVLSYHINVGHGNCSLILSIEKNTDKNKYWLTMVDCSIHDKTNNEYYTSNIEDCFCNIANKLNIEKTNISINLFLLTHFHYDHYNGIEYLIKTGYINQHTVFYMNLHYQMASKNVNNLFKNLLKINTTIIEPINRNGKKTSFIKILHPECSIFRSKNDVTNVNKICRVEGNVNNSSVVYMLRLGNKTMVLPGDLEKAGFKKMTVVATCCSFLHEANYYAVSHHGSINGHPAICCSNKSHKYNLITQCLASKLEVSFIMGRNGAYKGIYSAEVENFFYQYPNKRLAYTEYDCVKKTIKYFRLDWSSSKLTYFY